MKRVILEALKELGFELKKLSNEAYSFESGHLNYICINEKSDDRFLSMNLPGIVTMYDDNRMAVHELMSYINTNMRYVKTFLYDDRVWMTYEIHLQDGMDMKQCIKHMILALEAAALKAYLKLSKMCGKDDKAENDPSDVSNGDRENE